MSARAEPVWLTEAQVKMLHAQSLRLFGGSPGMRDAGLLQSALGRPQHVWTYNEAATLFDLAAAYGFGIAKNHFGIAKNHAFVDGNKRAALLAVRAFLFRNGVRFDPGEAETVRVIEELAGSTVSEEQLAEWIGTNSRLV